MTDESGGAVGKDLGKASLEAELRDILSRPFLLGHRGANNPDRPEEMAAAQKIENDLRGAVDRASEISFLLIAEELGVDPENFGRVAGYVRRPEDLQETGYHPDDICVPAYTKGMGIHIQKTDSNVIYRKKDAKPIDDPSRLWEQDLLWKQVATDFGSWPKEILNPVRYVQDKKESQLSLGRDVTRFNEAVAEIYEVLGLENPHEG